MSRFFRFVIYSTVCLAIGCSIPSSRLHPTQNAARLSASNGITFTAAGEMEREGASDQSPTVPSSGMQAVETRSAATPSPAPTRTTRNASSGQTPNMTQLPQAGAKDTPEAANPSLMLPDAPVNIFGPGEGSRVISPIQVEARLSSKAGRSLRIELRGSDGRLLARILKVPSAYPWTEAVIAMPVFFEINQAEEQGRLTVSVDDKYLRPIDANTVKLTLISSGTPQLHAHPWNEQAIVIKEPDTDTIVKGGTVQVSGLARADLNTPLNVELVSIDGSMLGFRLAAISDPEEGGYGSFTAGIPYSVTHHVPARLIVYADGVSGNERIHLSSVAIVLSP